MRSIKERINSIYPSFRYLLFIFLLLQLYGCAHVISRDLRDAVDPSLSFEQVLKDPNAYQGKTVLWGGEIIETLINKDGTSEIEVFQRPLGVRGEPKITDISEGRFIIHDVRYLDPYLYRRGRRITVAGIIIGQRVKPLGEMEYRYPLISSKQIYLWPEYYYYPYPYYYDPWWYYPRWWWRFGIHYHYRH